jgi:hypothetical protein
MKVADLNETSLAHSQPKPFSPSSGGSIPFVGRSLLVVAITALLMGYFAPNRREHFLRSDSGVFLYAGQQLLAGKTLYRDVWDHKPPLIFYLNAIGLALGGGSVWGVWALASVGVQLALLLIFSVCSRIFGDWPAALAAVGFGAAAIWPMDFGNATEVWALPLQAFVLYCILAERRRPVRCFVAGIAVGLLFCLQQNLIGIGIAAAICLFLDMKECGIRAALASCGLLAAGAMLAITLLAAYFISTGNFGEMYDAAFRFNFEYATTTWSTRARSLLPGINAISGAGVLLPALAGMVIAILSRFQQQSCRARLATMFAVIDLMIEIPLSCISGKGAPHYFITWTPALAVLSGYFGYAIARISSPDPLRTFGSRQISGANLVIVALTAVMTASLLRAALQKQMWRPDDGGRDALIAKLTSELTPADRIYVWGYAPEIYVATRHAAPTRFFMATPLRWREFTDQRMSLEIVDSLKRDPPRLIVDSAYAIEPNYPPLDEGGRDAWKHTHQESVDTLEPLFTFVGHNYSPRKVGRWVVYEHNP